MNPEIKKSRALFGLVACGGKSSRMGTDKGLLDYFGQAQRYRIYDMLAAHCQYVALSVNKDQVKDIPQKYVSIVDLEKYEEMGPMASILTAFSIFPDADFLVIGCDYPWITEREIGIFLENISGESMAAAFYNQDNHYEPLLACYSNACRRPLLERYQKGEYSLQHFLSTESAQKYIPSDPNVVISVDMPEEYERVLGIVKSQNEIR